VDAPDALSSARPEHRRHQDDDGAGQRGERRADADDVGEAIASWSVDEQVAVMFDPLSSTDLLHA
jgi:hypothetical protein